MVISDFDHLIKKENTGCWSWLGKAHNKGYPRITINGKRKSIRALFWKLSGKPDLRYVSSQIKMTCDDKNCVNPEHFVARKLPKEEIAQRKKKYQYNFKKLNPEKVKAWYKKWNSENPRGSEAQVAIVNYVNNLKEATPCVDCGFTYPAVCMDFDHVLERGIKLGSVKNFMYPGKGQELEDEIAKCDLVCANCHRIRTNTRGRAGWQRQK